MSLDALKATGSCPQLVALKLVSVCSPLVGLMTLQPVANVVTTQMATRVRCGVVVLGWLPFMSLSFVRMILSPFWAYNHSNTNRRDGSGRRSGGYPG